MRKYLLFLFLNKLISVNSPKELHKDSHKSSIKCLELTFIWFYKMRKVFSNQGEKAIILFANSNNRICDNLKRNNLVRVSKVKCTPLYIFKQYLFYLKLNQINVLFSCYY